MFIDIETYSDTDIAHGHYRYAEDDSFRVMLFAYADSINGPVSVIDLEHGEQIPEPVKEALEDPTVKKWAHNAGFERVCLSKGLSIPCPPEQWRCTASWARYLGLPGGLGALSEILPLGQKKDKVGDKLIKKFCTPAGVSSLSDQSDWELFKKYCAQDVRAEMSLYTLLKPFPVPEWDIWELDQRVNDIGMPVDVDLVGRVIDVSTDHAATSVRMAKQIMGIANPNSRDQVLAWLAGRGIHSADLTAKTVCELLERLDLPADVRHGLTLRQQMAKASIKKYAALSDAVSLDGRFRGAFVYSGAATHRWTGKIFQPQNLPRPTISDAEVLSARRLLKSGTDADTLGLMFDSVSEVLSSLVRSVIAAPKGQKLVVADYSSIESVMAAWAARSEYLLNLFRAGRDPYKDFATKLWPKLKYEDVTKAQRTLCKPVVLGGQYGLGAAGLKNYAAGFGLILTDAEAKKQIEAYRAAYSDIPKLWKDIKDAAFQAVSVRGHKVSCGRFSFINDGTFLILRLPSGRSLFYMHPRIEEGQFGDAVTYLNRGKVRVGVHPGRFVENIVQSISRDLLAHGMLNVSKDFEIVGHVHDEVICLASCKDGDALERMIRLMTTPPLWCSDAPIKADGYESEIYKK